MTELRIVSFLPSATEMACALGLQDQLVGITHECDYPPEIANKPVVVRNALRFAGMSLQQIDAAVSARIRTGVSLYEVDQRLLQELAPDLILTQHLCQVCAPSGTEIAQVLKCLRPNPRILWFTPKSLADIEENLRDLGQATGSSLQAELVIASGRRRVERLTALTSRAATRPRVSFLEWIDPVYCSGHWVPELVELGGGVDRLSRKAADSVRIEWGEVLAWAPEVLVIAPCGFDLAAAAEQAIQLSALPGWSELPAVRLNRVYAVDANSYFARPGPRVFLGAQLLAHLIHPELCEWNGPGDAFRQIEAD